MHQLSITSTLLYVIVALILYFIWKRKHLYYCSFKHPGPFGFPLIGSVHLLKPGRAETYNILMRIAQYAPVTRMWLGPFFHLFISKAEDTEILLNKCLDKSIYYSKYLGVALKNALPVSSLELWKERRKLINHSFNLNVIHSFIPVFDKYANCLADELDKICKGTMNSPDLFEIIWKWNIDIACETLGDVCPNSLHNRDQFLSCGFRFEESVKSRFFKPHLNINYFWERSPLRKEQLEISQVLQNFMKQIIDIKQNQPESEDRKKRFLNYLLEMKKRNKITMDGVLEEGALMFHAASETTALALCSALVMLGMHHEIQEKLFEEISSVLTDNTHNVTLQHINQMKYLERVIKETLRFFPTIPFILRQVNTEVKLGSYFVPAGCDILIPLAQLHRWPDLWPNPSKFDPDRFLPEEIKNRPRGAYLPFSTGPRNCIGWKYAMLSMKVFLAVILKRFKIAESIDYKRIEDIDMDMYLMGVAKKGYRIRLEDRN